MAAQKRYTLDELKNIVSERENHPARGGLLDKYNPTLKVSDVQEITGLSEKTIRIKLEQGEIPARKIGSRWIIPRDTFNDFIHGMLV